MCVRGCGCGYGEGGRGHLCLCHVCVSEGGYDARLRVCVCGEGGGSWRAQRPRVRLWVCSSGVRDFGATGGCLGFGFMRVGLLRIVFVPFFTGVDSLGNRIHV